ncbi:MAG: SRPBCC domain-containing protein [Reichenbachiella sp.]
MSLTITTQVTIAANPSKVWQVFSDFSSYSKWNPFVKAIIGEVKEGNTITAKFENMTFKPIVLSYQPNENLVWKGKLIFRGIFDGEHSFELKDNQDGTTTFIQSEYFTGLLVPIFKHKLNTEIKADFEKMNQALEQRVIAN